MKRFQVIVKRRLVVFLLSPMLVLLLSPNLQAQESRQTISQTAFLQLLQNQHPSFSKEALSNDIAKQDQRSQQAGQAWELELQAQQAHQTELLPSFGPEKIDQNSIGVSVSRPVWKTGAFVSIDAEGSFVENSYSDNVNPTFPNPDETETQQVSVTFSQPLLKNFKGKQSRLAYDLSTYSVRITSLQSQESQEQFLQSMLDEYLDWVVLAEQLAINEQRFVLAQKQASEIKKRLDKKLVERIDWLRSKDSERLAKQQFLLSRSQFDAKSQSLAHLSNFPDLASMSPDFELYDFPDLPELFELIEYAKTNTRNIRILDMQSEQLQRQLESNEDNKKAELNLDLRSAIKKENQSGLAPGQPDSDDGTDYSVGLNYKKKLGNDAAKSEYRKLQIQVDQNALEKQHSQMQVAANVKNLYIQLKEMKNILLLNKELVSTAQETTQEETRVYQQGRSDLTNVISSRDQTQNAKLQYAQNAVNYHKLYLQLESLTDRLLPSEQD